MAVPSVTPEMIVVFAVIGAAIVLFVTELLPVDITAIGVLVTLVVLEPWTGVTIADGLSGFANAATITVVAMYILSEGIRRTGAIRRVGAEVSRLTGGDPEKVLLATLGLGGPPAGFVNNTPIVAVLIPMVTDLADQHGISPSKLLLPLSYIAMMGGMLTLIGTSSNLLASELSNELIDRPFTMFEFTQLGAIVLVVGAVYLFTVGQWLLPERVPPAVDLTKQFGVEEHLGRVAVRETSPLIGRKIGDVRDQYEIDIDVLQLIRGAGMVLAPTPNQTIQANDILTLRGSGRARSTFADAADLRSLRRAGMTERTLPRGPGTLVAVVVPSPSPFVGKSVAETLLRRRYATTVLAVRKRDGELIRARLDSVTVDAGDTMLLHTTRDTIAFLRETGDLVVTEEIGRDVLEVKDVESGLYRPEKTPLAVGILAVVIALAAVGFVPIVLSALGGVVVMVAMGVLTPQEGYGAVNWDVIFLLAGMIPLGLALSATGGATYIAALVVDIVEPLSAVLVLGIFYILTAAVTNFVSNNASVILMVPIAIDVAAQLGANPFSFVLVVAFAASTSFMTPVGYQTNLMVYRPGGYRFTDYFRVGAPLQLLLAVVVTIGIALIWGV